jgi:hypothetical protein
VFGFVEKKEFLERRHLKPELAGGFADFQHRDLGEYALGDFLTGEYLG